MKISKTFSTVLFLILCLSIVTSCTKEEPADIGLNPFSNGGKERNMIVVISDIHLGADLAYAECNKNLVALEHFLIKLKAAPNVKELVIAGDMLDEWFVPATVDTYQGKDQADFVQRIATTNKGVINAINSIIKDKKILVTYVPGNHDLTITKDNVERILPGINQARDPEQGLGTYSPVNCPKIAIEHGHRYNFFCAPDPLSNQDVAPGTILPPGYFYTRIGVQSFVQNFPPAGDSIPLVTKNNTGDASQYLLFVYWNVWNKALTKYTLSNKFSDKLIVTNVNGFTGSYAVNDFLPHQATAGGWIEVNRYQGIQDTWDQRQRLNRVPVNIPTSQAIANAAKSSESEEQARNQYFLNPLSDKRIVIFGHTHEPKITSTNNHNNQKSIYANTGTWIDHNSIVPTTMSFIVVTPQKNDASSQTYVKLYHFEGETVTKMAEDSIRFE